MQPDPVSSVAPSSDANPVVLDIKIAEDDFETNLNATPINHSSAEELMHDKSFDTIIDGESSKDSTVAPPDESVSDSSPIIESTRFSVPSFLMGEDLFDKLEEVVDEPTVFDLIRDGLESLTNLSVEQVTALVDMLKQENNVDSYNVDEYLGLISAALGRCNLYNLTQLYLARCKLSQLGSSQKHTKPWNLFHHTFVWFHLQHPAGFGGKPSSEQIRECGLNAIFMQGIMRNRFITVARFRKYLIELTNSLIRRLIRDGLNPTIKDDAYRFAEAALNRIHSARGRIAVREATAHL
ncbi:hypothetical protein GEMRC1_012679 [Eukaryota sp. GEM-RC1]